MEITREVYQAVERGLSRRYNMRVREKARSPLMQFAAREILGKGGFVDPADFMEKYATTIPLPFVGPVAFVPWAKDSEGAWAGRVATITHEAQHAHQMGTTRRSRAKFSAGYLMDPTARADYEIEAYSVTLAVRSYTRGERIYLPGEGEDDWALNRAPLLVPGIVEALRAYGLSVIERNRARRHLDAAAANPERLWSIPAAAELRALLEVL